MCVLDNKKKFIDPKVIELDDNSEPEDDLDCIPPSPVPEAVSFTSSVLETRSVFSLYQSQEQLCVLFVIELLDDFLRYTVVSGGCIQ